MGEIRRHRLDNNGQRRSQKYNVKMKWREMIGRACGSRRDAAPVAQKRTVNNKGNPWQQAWALWNNRQQSQAWQARREWAPHIAAAKSGAQHGGRQRGRRAGGIIKRRANIGCGGPATRRLDRRANGRAWHQY
jgi:hypothetical protein